MHMKSETRELLLTLMHPQHADILSLVTADEEFGPQLALGHIQLMREKGEEITAELLALEHKYGTADVFTGFPRES
ncbi:hypothetical protein INR99_16185 [Chitinilyticum litopenaei]|uniref:Uncharacterized protein n=2 Tax=Chitinilyticum piscinae TaxID=2866724 RepID=A0A8J7FKF1_9NEIS|nr:hypothetical protein [Chitinilyticum piscinae]